MYIERERESGEVMVLDIIIHCQICLGVHFQHGTWDHWRFSV